MYAGVDSHKDTLAVAVIDTGGRVVTVRQLPNEAAGFAQLAAMAAEHGVARIGIEAAKPRVTNPGLPGVDPRTA